MESVPPPLIIIRTTAKRQGNTRSMILNRIDDYGFGFSRDGGVLMVEVLHRVGHRVLTEKPVAAELSIWAIFRVQRRGPPTDSKLKPIITRCYGTATTRK